jgi:hypothetical protein
MWYETAMSGASTPSNACRLQVVPGRIGLIDCPMIVAFGPLSRLLCYGKMPLVSGVRDHKSQAVHQRYLIGWVDWVKMLCFKIAIHNQRPRIHPCKRIVDFIIIGQIHVDSWLRACWAKQC